MPNGKSESLSELQKKKFSEYTLREKIDVVLMYGVVLPVICLVIISGVILRPHMYGLLNTDISYLHAPALKVLIAGSIFLLYMIGKLVIINLIQKKKKLRITYDEISVAFLSLGIQVLAIIHYIKTN